MSEDTYPAFGKIPRLRREVIVTEKIDGTNGLISVAADGSVRGRGPGASGSTWPWAGAAPTAPSPSTASLSLTTWFRSVAGDGTT